MQWYQWLLIGLGGGVAAMIPAAMYFARRTERGVRRLEQRARTAERLAELGTLTGGLAHEIKTPLPTIGLNLQLLRESLAESDLPEQQVTRLTNRLDAVSGEAERLREILEDFLAFAGRMKLDRHPVDLSRLAGDLVDFFEPQAEQSGVQVRPQLAEGLDAVSVDASLLKQAMLNLMINATQAMVEARYANKPHGGATDLIIKTVQRDDAVVVHVIDTGPGIEPERLEKVFHPYFSTKKGGTGLGLATSRRIIEEHGGEVTVHSELGRGTDFELRLPLGKASPSEDEVV